MTRVSEVINVFYSSTNPDGPFDRKSVFDDACRKVAISKHIQFHTIYWKKNIAGGIGMTSGQDVIDAAVEGQYDVYFGCLGATYGSGTVHEYGKAIEGHIRNSQPPYLFFGFDETPINPFKVDEKSLRAVKKFRSEIATSKKYGRGMLYFTFSTKDEFEEKIMLNMANAADLLHEGVLGGARIR
jgi:hypothetical protein